jgi:ATP-dependent helicase/nuclease subunit B
MGTFLQRTARAIIDRHGHDLQQVAIVVPGQRAAAHLQKYLAEAIGRPFWAPTMLDMGRFLAEVAGARQATQAELLLSLHRLHGTLDAAGTNDLSEFLQWAPTTLRDMSEVDHHLIDLDELYRDLRSFAEIDQWSLALGEDLSEGQKLAVSLWNRSGELHRLMHAQMAAERKGTSGWVAREAALRAAGTDLPWTAVWCVGANALEPAATAVLRAFDRRGMLHLAWDLDKYYLEDRAQEAGRFIRRSIEALGDGAVTPVDLFREQERTIRSVVVPDARSQTQQAAQWLNALPPDDRSKTLVLLADESLLPSLAASLPASCGPINISAGLPWVNWPLKGLFDLFINLFDAGQRTGTLPTGMLQAYLLHPLIARTQADLQGAAALRRIQRSRISMQEVREHLGSAPHSPTLLTALAQEALQPAANVFLGTLAALSGDEPYILEQVLRTTDAWNGLCAQITAAGLSVERELMHRDVRDRLMNPEPIGFFGDAAQGIQVMGLLETRALSPERVLVIGANEGHLPRSSGQQSFIPHDLRKALGLPLPNDSASVQAYHFQRLVQGTRELVLIGHSGGGPEPAETTRFIAQWEHELVPISRTRIQRLTVVAPSSSKSRGAVHIERAPWITEELKRMATKGISPSTLSIWLRCPMDLFFRRVMRVREPEDYSPRLESRVLGSAVHEVLRKSIEPHLGQVLRPEHLDGWRQGLAHRLAAEVAAELRDAALDRGHHMLSLAMAEEALDRYLRSEAGRIEGGATVTPLAVELDVEQVLPNGFRIVGRCDRVDLRDGTVHILDLKTGNVRPEQVKLRSLERSMLKPGHGYALQLLTYAWVYMHRHPDVHAVCTGLIPLQQPSNAEGIWLSVNNEKKITRDMLGQVTELLCALTDEIVHGTAPFTHDPASDYCACCLT